MLRHDSGKSDTVTIDGTPHEVVEMRRMQLEGEAMTLILKAKNLGPSKPEEQV